MNSNALARHYDWLTADERFVMLMAAALREDEVEEGRLLDTAPRMRLNVPHTFPLTLALQSLCDTFARKRLELALYYLRAMRAAEDADLDPPTRSQFAARLHDAGRVYAYLMGVYREAWNRFGTETGLDLDAVYELADGSPGLREIEREAEAVAFPPAEALDALCRVCGADGTLRTADVVLAEMHALYGAVAGYFK